MTEKRLQAAYFPRFRVQHHTRPSLGRGQRDRGLKSEPPTEARGGQGLEDLAALW